MRPKVGVVLGSGGLRGLAHIGVLKVLLRENIPDIAHIQPSSFEHMDECVLLGEQATESVILDIKRLLNNPIAEYKELDNESPMPLRSN